MGKLSPADIQCIFDWVMRILQLVTTVWAVWVIVQTVRKEKAAPEDMQNERISALEEWRRKVDDRLSDGEDHFSNLDKSTAIMLKAEFEILEAQISGDNEEGLKACRKEMHDYLSEKGIVR